MRRFHLLLLPLALTAALVTGWFATAQLATPYAIELEAVPARADRIQLFFDVGQGYREQDSLTLNVSPGPAPLALRFPLHYGTYRAFRLDPTDSNGVTKISRLRLTGRDGRVLRTFAPAAFLPNPDVAGIEVTGESATIRPTPNAGDAYVTLALPDALVLTEARAGTLAAMWPTLLWWTALFWGFGAALTWTWWRRGELRALADRHPQTGLFVVALVATVAACYPVVFLGRSIVSPNNGSALLYPSNPTVPVLTDSRTTNVHHADIGAMMWQNLPYGLVQSRALLDDKELPLWNRYNSSGVTLLGQGQSMFGDPIHLLLIVATRGAVWAWDLKFLIARLLFGAGLALCVWLLTRDWTAAALIALAAPLFAFFNYRFNHPAIFSVSYSPWILVAWMTLTDAAGRRATTRALGLWALANVTVICSGTVKDAYLLVAGLNATGALYWLLVSPLRGRARLGQAGLFAVTALASVLLTAPVWSTFFASLTSATTTYETPWAVQIHRSWFIGLFDDLFFRELVENHGVYTPALNFIAWMGVLWALANPRRLWQARGPVALLAGALISLLFAFDGFTKGLILATPFLKNVYHVNNMFSAIAMTPLAVLAGWGFHAAREPLARRGALRPVAIGLGVTVLFLIYYFQDAPAVWTGESGQAHRPDHAFFYTNIVLLLAGGCLLTALAARRLVSGRPLGVGSVLLGALAFAAVCYRHGLQAGDGGAGEYLTVPMVRADLYAPSPSVTYVLADRTEPFRTAGLDYYLFAGYAAGYGLEGINGLDAIMNRSYHEIADTAEMIQPGDWHLPIREKNLPAIKPILSFFGLRYLLAPYGALAKGYAGLTPVAASDLQVFRNDGAWPRAFFTDRIIPYKTPTEFLRLVRADGAPFAAFQAGVADTPPLTANPGGQTVRPATAYHLTANTTTFTIAASGPGVAVLGEVHYPGDFRVTLNGAPADYFRVNHAFKGVRIPAAGTYTLSFSYWPRYLTPALWLALAGFVLLAAGACWGLRPERRFAGGPELVHA